MTGTGARAATATAAGVRRFVLLSAIGADDFDPSLDDDFEVYLEAKSAADAAVRGSDLEWTILRPGQLTDDPGTGTVLLAPPPVPRATVTRDDTAAVLAALLDAPGTAGQVLELRNGEDDVLAAVARVSGPVGR